MQKSQRRENNENVFKQNQVARIKFREFEDEQIRQFLNNRYEFNFLMVTGLPGSGKTLVTTNIMNSLPNAKKVIINAMTCSNYIDFLNLASQQLGLKLTKMKDINNLSIKSKFKQEVCNINKYQDVVMLIDEFEQLFQGNDKDAFDLFILSQTIKIIGISNDIEFLQSQSSKFKLQMPKIENIIFKPYNYQQIQELALHFAPENQEDTQAIRLLSMKAYADKGGDLRNVKDICNQLTKGQRDVITKDELNRNYGDFAIKDQIQRIVDNLTIQQQIVMMAIYLLDSIVSIEQSLISKKINEVKYQISLDVDIEIEEILETLKDYNFISIKTVMVNKNGFKQRIKQIVPKLNSKILTKYRHLLRNFKLMNINNETNNLLRKLRKVTFSKASCRSIVPQFRYNESIERKKTSDALSDTSCICEDCGGKVKKKIIVYQFGKQDQLTPGTAFKTNFNLTNLERIRKSAQLDMSPMSYMNLPVPSMRQSYNMLNVPSQDRPKRNTLSNSAALSIVKAHSILMRIIHQKSPQQTETNIPLVEDEQPAISVQERMKTEPVQEINRTAIKNSYYIKKYQIRSIGLTPTLLNKTSQQYELQKTDRIKPQHEQREDKKRALSYRLQRTYLRPLKMKR